MPGCAAITVRGTVATGDSPACRRREEQVVSSSLVRQTIRALAGTMTGQARYSKPLVARVGRFSRAIGGWLPSSAIRISQSRRSCVRRLSRQQARFVGLFRTGIRMENSITVF